MVLNKTGKAACLVWTILLFILLSAPGCRATVIKVALVTPEGSTWTRTLHRMAGEISEKTEGRIQFQIYAGGVSGDEMDVLRKMQIGRIDAAGFSGVGLGMVLPSVRILEAPLLFRSYEEIDHVKETLYSRFAAEFKKKGYVLLGFAEAGFVYFFSKNNPSGDNALRQVKMWTWKGDPVAETFLDIFNIPAYPLHLTDVNTGLETGMIDAFYSPPLAAVAFQWYARIRYLLEYPMVNSGGALLMRKAKFDRISEKDRMVLARVAREYCQELVRLTREDNREALMVLQEAGIQFVPPSQGQIAAFERNAPELHRKHFSKLYSEALYNEVSQLIQQYRSDR